METTILSYWDNTYQFSDISKILDLQDSNTGAKCIILDHTIMYPQGGGQPYDTGIITHEDRIFHVNEVRFKDGLVFHLGTFENDSFDANILVNVHIDEERRKLNARLHTAGHLVDDAMYELGYKLIPNKGYHFPDGPYVEYFGVMDGNLEQIADEIENKINQIIKSNFKVQAEIISEVSQLVGKVMHIPQHLPEGKPIRIVYVSEPSRGQPCGGTHVQYLMEVEHVSIPKIKIKNGNTKISYLIK